MNREQLMGNWEMAKGKVREMWGKLTDNDLTVIRGNIQQLSGKLQERYGYAKKKAEEEIDRFLAKYPPEGDEGPLDDLEDTDDYFDESELDRRRYRGEEH